ncbi:hypothetical protein S100390_v1c07270 [Spiroplasma sp. NBRC 100390]|uniref:hypothetical protein n=1 Tax=unclassified Spiroplasma TaxID=2637901 RepID=UPI00089283BB|nr:MULTISPECIES: hypothetical protein [unclassified Spiroplasma]AOX44063.1 hypothetical protein STU14_v1c07270 [Spiroplasma sp. TU-14]APE13533.1 hypothetical protein S100390_v1c07270 [Spiroplasma sp. NBRC 100390]
MKKIVKEPDNLELKIKEFDQYLFKLIPEDIEKIFTADIEKTDGPTLRISSFEEKIDEIYEKNEEMQANYFIILSNNEFQRPIIWGDLFYEIEEVISYLFDIKEHDRGIMNPYFREFMDNIYYHRQMSTFLYIMSSLDKITTLLHYGLSKKDNYEELLKNITEKYKGKRFDLNKLYFDPHFFDFSLPFVKKELVTEYIELINFINESPGWKLLKKMRNTWAHNHSAPNLPNNIGIMIKISFSFLLRICVIINRYFIHSKDEIIARNLLDLMMSY